MLTSVAQVIDALGGTAAAASIAGVGAPAVSNWKDRGYIPPGKFLAFTKALAERGLTAAPIVFGWKDEARA